MQDIGQNSKRGRIHWCSQPLTRSANSGATAPTVRLLPIVGTNSFCSTSQWFTFPWFFPYNHNPHSALKESSSLEPRCEEVEVVAIDHIREQLAKCIKHNLLLRLASSELAQEDQRPTSCRRLLDTILLLHQWSHIKDRKIFFIFWQKIQTMRSKMMVWQTWR